MKQRPRGVEIFPTPSPSAPPPLPRADFFPAFQEFEAGLDLFGDPARYDAPRRGRPPHVPTDEKRSIIKILRDEGRSLEAIAAAIGLSVPTLHRRYSDLISSPGGAKRPAYLPSAERRAIVRELRAGGHRQAEIAQALGISVSTLRRHHSTD